MRKFLSQTVFAGVIGLLASGITLQSRAADSDKPPAKEETPAPRPRGVPYNGKVASVDKIAKTITLNGEKNRVIQVTSKTRIMKDGKPATFDDATVGEKVGGFAHQVGDKLEARSLNIGAKPEAKPHKKAPEKPDKEAPQQ
jgi:hypothetical protein